MDHWSKESVEMLRQGGNQRIRDYFKQLNVEGSSTISLYQSEAASHYRERLRERVKHILSNCSRSKTSVPNDFNLYTQAMSEGNEISTKYGELVSLEFTEEKLGMRLSKPPNNIAVVSRVTPGGCADLYGITTGDCVWGIGSSIVDDFDEIIYRISTSPRPLCIRFYKEAGSETEDGSQGSSDGTAAIDGESDSEGSCCGSEGSAPLLAVLMEGESSSRRLSEQSTGSDEDDSPRIVSLDYRVTFEGSPLGMTISEDHLGRAEVTALSPDGRAARGGVHLRDLVIGAGDDWFLHYKEAMRLLPLQAFPLTIVFRRITRSKVTL